MANIYVTFFKKALLLAYQSLMGKWSEGEQWPMLTLTRPKINCIFLQKKPKVGNSMFKI
jgi:hypothetical protein